MTPTDSIVRRLAGIPLLQAPMAGVATPALAAAVSEAGAIGGLGIGASSVADARAMIRETRARTAAPFNVNVFCHRPATVDEARERAWLSHLAPLFAEFDAEPPTGLREIYRSFLDDDDAFRMLLAEKPAVVSFHFGLPCDDRIAALRAAGIFTLASATSTGEARAIERSGVDGVVAQGIEAGGHRGMFDPEATDERSTTAVLTRRLVRTSSLPVIAAGGIMDGAGIRTALSLGALAAQLGTAFILCPESSASAGYRALLRGPEADHTRLTSTLSGRPARGIDNRYIAHGESPGSPRPAAYPMAYDAAKQLHALATRAGIHDFGAHWAGQGAALAREMPAAELVAVLMSELSG